MSHQHAHHGSDEPHVHRITEARESHTVEQDTRVRKYTITMTVRVVCFVLAFFTTDWLRWFFLIGAIFLPYIAVVIANGGADITRRQPPAEFYQPTEPEALEGGHADVAPAPEGAEVIDGTLVEDQQPEQDPGDGTAKGKEN